MTTIKEWHILLVSCYFAFPSAAGEPAPLELDPSFLNPVTDLPPVTACSMAEAPHPGEHLPLQESRLHHTPPLTQFLEIVNDSPESTPSYSDQSRAHTFTTSRTGPSHSGPLSACPDPPEPGTRQLSTAPYIPEPTEMIQTSQF